MSPLNGLPALPLELPLVIPERPRGRSERELSREQSFVTVSFPFPPSFRYSTKNPSLQSETVHYKRGVSQQFSLPSFKIDFSEWKDDEVSVFSVSPSFHSLLSQKH